MHVGCLAQPAASRNPPSASASVPLLPACDRITPCMLTVFKIFCRSSSLSQNRPLRTWRAHQQKVDEATAFALALCCHTTFLCLSPRSICYIFCKRIELHHYAPLFDAWQTGIDGNARCSQRRSPTAEPACAPIRHNRSVALQESLPDLRNILYAWLHA